MKKLTEEQIKQLVKEAKKDWKASVKKASKKTIKNYIKGPYGFHAMHFAKNYVNPLKEPEAYRLIYDVPYQWAENFYSKNNKS